MLKKQVERVGPQHQAGSDSMLTSFAFFKMRRLFFEDQIDDAKYQGHLYGLGSLVSTHATEEAPVSYPLSPAPSTSMNTVLSPNVMNGRKSGVYI